MSDESQAALGRDEFWAPAPKVEPEQPGPDESAAVSAVPPPAPPSFTPEPPMPWAPVDPAVGSAPLRGNHPWGMIDPGLVRDGTWLSRGYAASSKRAAFVRLVLGAQIALDIGLFLFERGLVFAGDSGLRLSAGQAAVVRSLLGAIEPVSIMIGLVVMIGIFAWISRVVENVPALTGRTPQSSPRQSIGWWFVPVASWLMPFTIVRDAAWRLRATADDAAVRLILPWWLLHVAASIVGFVFGRGLVHLDTSTTVLVAQAVLVVEALGDALLIAVVASVARNERIQAARLDFSGRRSPEWPRFAQVDDDQEQAIVDFQLPTLAPRNAFASFDPLAQGPNERSDDYEARLLAALEAEATQR